MPQTASRISRFTLDANRTVTDGSIRIQNIYVANSTDMAAEVVFQNNDSSPILNMVVGAMDSEQFSGNWIADNGLKILGLSEANIVVIILHTSEGV